MGRDKYPKKLKAAYGLTVNWRGDTKGTGVTPNDGVAFTTDLEDADIHATDSMKLTLTGKPVICHISGKNHYSNRCLERE